MKYKVGDVVLYIGTEDDTGVPAKFENKLCVISKKLDGIYEVSFGKELMEIDWLVSEDTDLRPLTKLERALK